uniref:Uncharacterized protein n=1 Tax=Micrurus corallinus TaxID=54390 RepID=A0A2D4F580_MICCO
MHILWVPLVKGCHLINTGNISSCHGACLMKQVSSRDVNGPNHTGLQKGNKKKPISFSTGPGPRILMKLWHSYVLSVGNEIFIGNLTFLIFFLSHDFALCKSLFCLLSRTYLTLTVKNRIDVKMLPDYIYRNLSNVVKS